MVDYNYPYFPDYTEYQNFATASRTSPMNSPHLGMVTSNVLLGQHDHQAHAENTQTGLTLAEVMELAKIMDLPLEKKLFLEKGDIDLKFCLIHSSHTAYRS